MKEWNRQCLPQTPHDEKFIDQQFHLVFITIYCFIDFDLATSQSQNLHDISLSSRDLRREKKIDQTPGYKPNPFVGDFFGRFKSKFLKKLLGL